jgi:carboxyl-terminal processing protease
MQNYKKWQPFIYALLIALGIAIGVWLKPSGKMAMLVSGNSRVSEVLKMIHQFYVDEVDIDSLETLAINNTLSELDPHSVYIPASELSAANEQLEGNFEGIGVEFAIYSDTIMVVAAINGGPSEIAGIKAGDRIVKVNDTLVCNTGITNEKVYKLLRGPKGTKVKVTVYRPVANDEISYTLKRGTIPIHSVDAYMMLDAVTGYVKVSRFSANTHQEFLDGLAALDKKGMQQLILDLRGNPGGYLSAAIDITDEFLDDNKKIVYTKGRVREEAEYDAERKGVFESGKLVVLIDEGSASASEIVSGALQDWDRGIIIGRRSFGKGLVQEPFDLKDGSALRLTVSRYYTPSGRCIQKKYSDGAQAYEEELMKRFQDGELEDISKNKLDDTTRYYTHTGRIVYGGGGIIPDIFVAIDTTVATGFINRLLSANMFNQFAYAYCDRGRKEFVRYTSVEAFIAKAADHHLVQQFSTFCKQNKIAYSDEEFSKSYKYIDEHLKALIARQIWRENGYYTVLNKSDKVVQQALAAFKNYDNYLRKK